MNNTDNKLNYFRNYLESTPYHTFRKSFNSYRLNNNNDNINNDKYGRLTYYRDLRSTNNKKKNNDNDRENKANIKTFRQNNTKLNKSNNKNNIFNNRKSQSSNKINNNIKNEINNNCNISKKKDMNKAQIKNNNKKVSKTIDKYKSLNNSNEAKINSNSTIFGNNEDIKGQIKQNSVMNENSNSNSNSNSNIIDLNINQSNKIFGKIISHNNSMMTSPINRNNQINFNQNIYPTPKANYSTYDFEKKTNSIIFSKRMQNYLHNQNLQKRFDEISKESSNSKINRINNIINTITNDKDKLNELKLMFGNSIEAQILNGDLSNVYLNKIENILYYMEESKSIIPLSKRFQIQNNSSKKNKIIYGHNDNNNIKTGRFIRKKLTDKNYNKSNIRRWNTSKYFFDNNKRNDI